MELVDLAPVLTDAAGTPASGFRRVRRRPRRGRTGEGHRGARAWPAITRREIDELTERAKRFGAKGLAYLALEAGGEVKGPIAKFLSDDTQAGPASSGPAPRRAT